MPWLLRSVGYALAGIAVVTAAVPTAAAVAPRSDALAVARAALAADSLSRHVAQGMNQVPQTIPTDVSDMIMDPRGDAYWGRGDLVTVQATARLGALQLAVFVDLYEDPRSANWQAGGTFIAWKLDVNGDSNADFSAMLVGAEGSFGVVILREEDLAVRCVVPPVVVPEMNAYVLSVPMDCVQSPKTYSWNVEMHFEDLADPIVSTDLAPDQGWTTSIAIPGGAMQRPSTYAALQPTRLLDSRGAPACSTRVPVAGQAGVPVDAVAAAVTLTVPSATGSGYATAWPSGEPAPNASNVNYAAGETRANGAIVRLGSDGAIEVSTSTCEAMLIDVAGVFVPVDASGAGRLQPITPVRAIDRAVEAGQDVVLTADQLHIPPTATAVAVNITIDRSHAGGFVTAWAAGGPKPDASVLNTDGPSQTRAAAGLVPVSPAGIALAQNIGGRILVDVTGYMTGAGTFDIAGLFVPQSPARVLDTRPTRVQDWTSVEIPDHAGAIAASVTITDAEGPGWLTVAPAAGGDVNATSTVNAAGTGQSTANFAIVPVDDGVKVAVGGTSAAAIVDLAGWFIE